MLDVFAKLKDGYFRANLKVFDISRPENSAVVEIDISANELWNVESSLENWVENRRSVYDHDDHEWNALQFYKLYHGIQDVE